MIPNFSHKCDAKSKQLLCDVTQSEVVWSGQRENDNDPSPPTSATNLSVDVRCLWGGGAHIIHE